MTVSCLVARSSCFSLNLLVFLLYSDVFFLRMSETECEPRHFGHGARARHAPTKPRFPTFWGDKRIFARSALCLGAPLVVNNPGNRVAASMFRPRMLRSGHKIHNESAARWLCFVGDAPYHAKFCACFCLPNNVVSCETAQIAVFGVLPTHAKRTEKSVAARERKAFLSIVTPVEVFCLRAWVMRLV